ncbi:MAG: hypothetical protein H0T17_05350 [Propionibacteriales bacterium]|nr:hypothetical protein [Propionibacteriales bacterium]
MTGARVSLLRWLRRQLAQPLPVCERLEAAVANDDPDEVLRLLERFEFSPPQRRHVEQLLRAWQEERGRS